MSKTIAGTIMLLHEVTWPVLFDLKGNIIDLHQNLFRHIYTDAKYFFLGQKEGYKIITGQEHLAPPPIINVFLLVENGNVETPKIWTFTDIQMNESMEMILNA